MKGLTCYFACLEQIDCSGIHIAIYNQWFLGLSKLHGSGECWKYPATPNDSGHPPSATPVLNLMRERWSVLMKTK